ELKEKRQLHWIQNCEGCNETLRFLDTSLCRDCYNIEKLINNNKLVNYLIDELTKTSEMVNKLEGKVSELQERVDQLEEKDSQQTKNTVYNVLLIGRTGNGKSTLANVLSGTTKFKEGKYAVSETRDIQDATFEYLCKRYRIIDTVGIGDTKLSEKEVLDKMAEATYSIRDGLYQVLFVTS
ncbi:16467_t:CDS:2, partial [Racocetra fulgida]